VHATKGSDTRGGSRVPRHSRPGERRDGKGCRRKSRWRAFGRAVNNDSQASDGVAREKEPEDLHKRDYGKKLPQ